MSYSSDSSSPPASRPRASPDPQRTLARELLEQELRRGGGAQQQTQQWTAHPSPASEFEHTQYRPSSSPLQMQQAQASQQSAAFADYRAEYGRQPTAAGASSNYPQHPELRALSETMRSVHVPSNLDTQSYSNQQTQQQLQHGAQFCQICEADEGGMNPAQRRQHEQHLQERMYYQSLQQQQQQQQQTPAYTAGWGVYAEQQQPALSSYAPAGTGAGAGASLASSFRTTVASPQRTSATLGLASQQPPVMADESVLYTSQPSRAVLSALRTLQDKLQELRVEKSNLENQLAQQASQASLREHEQARAHERAQSEALRKAQEFEASYLAKLRDQREAEERAQAQVIKLENEVRMLRDQALQREADSKSLRDEGHQLRLQLNDAELAHARISGEKTSLLREAEQERSTAVERELEITRLKGECNSLAAQLHQAGQNIDQLKLTNSTLEQNRAAAEANNDEANATVARLAHELKTVSQECIVAKNEASALQSYKYLTREYVSSLLNLNYELCIDVGMPLKKRNDLLTHSQQLLQGLKKAAWATEVDHAGAGGAASNGSAAGASTGGEQDQQAGGAYGSPARKAVIGGVHTGIDEQQYLLAGASSPEAIRVLHPSPTSSSRRAARAARAAAASNDVDSSDEDASDSHTHASSTRRASSASSRRGSGTSGGRIPAAPTVASTAKTRRSSGVGATSSGGLKNHHTLNKEIALPFTIGRSVKQSFSVPVNVQEILSKQPAYYSKVAARQVALQRKRMSGGGGGGSAVASSSSRVESDDERSGMLVYPPAPASSSSESAPGPVSLSSHSQGLSTVLLGLESEIESLNRDYIFHLDHSRREKDEDKLALQSKLQSILKAIEKKTKQIEALKQHQEAVLGSHSGGGGGAGSSSSSRLHAASTASSRGNRASSAIKPQPSSTHVPLSNSGKAPAATKRRGSVSRKAGTATGTAASSKASSRRGSSAGLSGGRDPTDLTDRHAHHQHGTQSSTPLRRRGAGGLTIDSDDEDALGAPLPQFGFLSPNSQRLLHKKMQSMRLLGQFQSMFEPEAARRFGAD